MSKIPIQFTLNGKPTSVFANSGANLLEVLRRDVGDMTTKYGCGQGTCGTCTVLIDGEPHLGCLTLAETVEGRQLDTVNGLANGSELHPLQKLFMEKFAAQCGFCTPGMLMVASSLLKKNPNPSREEVIEAISGNICRCTGYEPIIDTILEAAIQMRGRAF